MLTQAKVTNGRYVTTTAESGRLLEDGSVKLYMQASFTHFQDDKGEQIEEQGGLFAAVNAAVTAFAEGEAAKYK